MSGLIEQMNEAVAQALVTCVRTGGLRTYAGTMQTDLLQQLQELLECAHVGLSSSGTAALEAVLVACDLAAGDEVLLSGYDYPGNFSAIERAGARPVLVDVEPGGWQISQTLLNEAYSPACRALVVSHLHGQLQPMHSLGDWCRERGIRLIQDACQALGAQIQGEPLTSLADATILSFGGSKVMSAGRGGAWATRDATLAQHLRISGGAGSGRCELSELQAAALRAQLPFLRRINAGCRTVFSQQAARWATLLPGLVAPWEAQVAETAFYQAGWLLPPPAVRQDSAASAGNQPVHWLERLPAEQIQALRQLGIGGGFPGYHRRSARRCRIPRPLQQTADIVSRTLTVHFSAALSLLENAIVLEDSNHPNGEFDPEFCPTDTAKALAAASDQTLIHALTGRAS